MKIWNILETAEEVDRCLKDKDYEQFGTVVLPETLQPHACVRVKNYADGNDVVFLVPMITYLPNE